MGLIFLEARASESSNVIDEHGIAPLILCTILTGATLCALCLRLYARFFILRRPGWDDYLVTISTLLTVGALAAFLVRSVQYDGMRNERDMRSEKKGPFYLAIWIGTNFFLVGINLTKATVLLFYKKIFLEPCGRVFYWVNIATLAAVIYNLLSTFIGHILVCRPVDAYWSRFSYPEPYSEDYQCRDRSAWIVASAATNAGLDFWITSLPLFFLRKVQIPAKRKWPLFGLFAVGYVVCIISSLRTRDTALNLANPDDYVWNSYSLWSWTMAELNLAIICASVPAIRPLFHKIVSERSSSGSSNLFRRAKRSQTRTDFPSTESKEQLKFSPDFELKSANDLERQDHHRHGEVVIVGGIDWPDSILPPKEAVIKKTSFDITFLSHDDRSE